MGNLAHALDIEREIADILWRQAPRDGLHYLGVRPAAALALVVTRIALVRRVLAELLHGIDGVLGTQHRIAGGRIAAPDRPMAGHAGRDVARAIAAAIE